MNIELEQRRSDFIGYGTPVAIVADGKILENLPKAKTNH